MIEAIKKQLSFGSDGGEAIVTSSIGISISPFDGNSAETLRAIAMQYTIDRNEAINSAKKF